jgi:molybdopterin/thiamine biosynthesis adenylyltransferase
MTTITFAAPSFKKLREQLQHPELESAAILLCSPMLRSSGGWRLLVVEVHVPTEADYTLRSAIRVEINSAFCLPIEQAARQRKLSLVYVHTHPGANEAVFSSVDDAAERQMAGYLKMRGPDVPHAALLFAKSDVSARLLGTDEPVTVVEVGDTLDVYAPEGDAPAADDQFDRQVRAFGEHGQHRLSELSLTIVGLGGTGSLVAQQAAHLGVRNFLLVDDDRIESTNLNRVVGAARNDVGRAKVEVALRMIQQINPEAQVTLLESDVTKEGVARRAMESDLVFCCTDSHASRHVLNQAAYQYLTPVIDMGVSINVANNGAATFAGHSKLLSPGQACLWCAKHLNSEQVRRELMTDAQRAVDPYVQGAARVVQPAVISLNGTMASVSMTMMLAVIAGVPAAPRYVLYQGNRARMNAAVADRDEACPFCGPSAPVGWGDLLRLPRKQA